MNGHRRFLELAASSIDFRLLAGESAELSGHLAGCRACAAAAAAFRADAEALAIVSDIAPGEHVRTAVVAAASRPARGRMPRLVALVAAAAVVAATALVGTLAAGSVLRGLRDDPAPLVERVTWTRVPAFDAGDSVPSGEILTLAVADGRVYAAGSGPGAAPLWTSPDAVSWTTARSVALAGARIADLSTGEQGILAVGHVLSPGGLPRGAVWWSPDGTSWERTEIEGALSLGAALSKPSVLVAAGVASDGGVPIWTSVDGRTWGRASDAAGFENAHVEDVAVGGDGFLAVGYDDRGAVAWTTVDGLSWERLPSDPSFELTHMTAVTRHPDGYVAVGADARGAVAWSSPDGNTWNPSRFEGEPMDARLGDAWMVSVVSTPLGLIAIGNDRAGGVAWASADGSTWRRLPAAAAVAGSRLGAAAAYRGDVLAGGRMSTEAALWRAALR